MNTELNKFWESHPEEFKKLQPIWKLANKNGLTLEEVLKLKHGDILIMSYVMDPWVGRNFKNKVIAVLGSAEDYNIYEYKIVVDSIDEHSFFYEMAPEVSENFRACCLLENCGKSWRLKHTNESRQNNNR